MFSCKSCQQRDRLIAAQEAQIAFLRSLISTPSSQEVSVTALEADAVLSGNQNVIEIDADDSVLMDEADSERSRLLSGTY
jgi:hypothetical protein